MSSLRRRAAGLPAWVAAALLAAGWLAADPRTSDLAAQTYRADLFARAPFALWDNGWYSGHHLPAYSLLVPPLGALIGTRLTGALAAVALVWAWERLVGPGHRLAGAWAALGATAFLVSGRITFLVGAALALGALAAARRRARGPAVVLAALSSAASPVAGAFLALAAAAWWLGDRPSARRAAALAVAAIAPAAVLAVLFPEGGTFPFAASSFWPALALTVLTGAALPAEHRVLRAGAALCAVLLVASWALPTPMGGNAVRLGALLGGPVATVGLLGTGRRRAWLLLAPLLLAWQLRPAVDDWRQSAHDPSVQPRAAAGLRAFLAAAGGPPSRVEVPFTDNHWEAANLTRAPGGALLARGWERQYDRRVNGLFYDGRPLTPARYRAWLDANAVRFVALADAPVDYSAAAEARLVRGGLPFLHEVYRDRTWTAWEVRGARPLGATRVGVDGFTARSGAVAIRWSPWFAAVSGAGCAWRDPATGRVLVRAAGLLTVRARLGLGGLLRRTRTCHGRDAAGAGSRARNAAPRASGDTHA